MSKVDLVKDSPVVPPAEVDLVEDAPEIPPALRQSVEDFMLPGETQRQCVRRLTDEAERKRLSAVLGSRFHQSRQAVEQELAKTR